MLYTHVNVHVCKHVIIMFAACIQSVTVQAWLLVYMCECVWQLVPIDSPTSYRASLKQFFCYDDKEGSNLEWLFHLDISCSLYTTHVNTRHHKYSMQEL